MPIPEGFPAREGGIAFRRPPRMGTHMKPVFLNLPGHLINLQRVNSLEVERNFLVVCYHGSRQSIPYGSEEEAEEAFASISSALYSEGMTLFAEWEEDEDDESQRQNPK